MKPAKILVLLQSKISSNGKFRVLLETLYKAIAFVLLCDAFKLLLFISKILAFWNGLQCNG
jgi:hypothetical protein